MKACADVVDDGDNTLVARVVRDFPCVLRVHQHERHAGGARRVDPALQGRAKESLIHSDERIVGSDLPDDGRAHFDFKAAKSLGSVLAASSPPTPAFRTSAWMPSSCSSSSSSCAG